MARITLEGELETDGLEVYVGGMDLSNIMRAALPNRPANRNQPPKIAFGHATVTIEADIDDASRPHKAHH